MARLETQGYLKSRVDGNTIGYSVPLSSNSIRANHKLKDEYFLSYSTAPYARKTARIYQFGYGINGTQAGGEVRDTIANTIRIDNNCARFIPVCDCTAPETSTSDNRFISVVGNSQQYQYTQEGYDFLTTRKFKNYRCKYMWGDDLTEKGGGCNSLALATKWTVKQWAVLPLLVGIYSGIGSGSGGSVSHANSIDLDTYFADPSQYPLQVAGYSDSALLGFSYGFVLLGNLADNTQGAGRVQLSDCGYEMFQEGSLLVGGYGQSMSPPYPSYANDVYEVNALGSENIRQLRSFSANNTFLGLALSMSNGFANSYGNLMGANFATPTFPFNGDGVSYSRAGIRAFEVVGDPQYISWTTNKYFIGRAGDSHDVESEIPFISAQYIDKDFLIKVASQLGLPVLTSWATAESFESASNINTWYEENGDKVLIPDIGKDGKVEDNAPTRYDELPEDDDRRDYLDSNDPLQTLDPPDTSDIDPNHYTDETPLNYPTITAVGAFNKYFALSEDDIEDLCDFLYTNNQSAISDMLDRLKLNGENPMNFLISLKMFPFDIGEYADITPANIGFGNGVDTGIVAERVNSFTAVLDLGSCTFRQYNHNFYDYEPYTNAKLYIPYCGEVSINTAQFVGHTINVKMIVDIITGACCGVVFCDGIAVSYSNGNIAVEIPITGENATEYVSRGMADINKTIGSVIGLANGGGVSSLMQGLEAGYDFNNIPTPLQTNGTSTPQTNFYKPQKCYFVVQSPVLLPTAAYKSQVGYACEVTRTLNDVHGFTVCGNVTNITPAQATEQEINEIKQLLESGVYL